MKSLNVAICEDMPADAVLLRHMIKESGVFCRIFVFETGEAFLKNFQPGLFQLILLDIYLQNSPGDPHMAVATGLELAQKIRESDNDVWLAFTTASPDHAAQGYRVRAYRYLQKPLDKAEICALLTRAACHFESVDDEISVIVERKPCGVRIRDILYAEAQGKQSLIHMRDKVITTYTKFDDIGKLLDFMPFFRCHRCYVVNMDYVKNVDRDFKMINGNMVYISRNLLRKARETYHNYIVYLAQENEI